MRLGNWEEWESAAEVSDNPAEIVRFSRGAYTPGKLFLPPPVFRGRELNRVGRSRHATSAEPLRSCERNRLEFPLDTRQQFALAVQPPGFVP